MVRSWDLHQAASLLLVKLLRVDLNSAIEWLFRSTNCSLSRLTLRPLSVTDLCGYDSLAAFLSLSYGGKLAWSNFPAARCLSKSCAGRA